LYIHGVVLFPYLNGRIRREKKVEKGNFEGRIRKRMSGGSRRE